VARRFGFVEYDGPPLEPLELYTRKSGDEIVSQLYNFTDKGGREVALRPEMTPTFARMVAARANALRKPVRWFSIPQLFRYERQQKGRLREHFQLNVDIVGESGVTADAELLAVAIEIMRGAGLTPDDVVARFSDRRLLVALLRGWGVPDESVPAAYAAIDKLGREPRDALVSRLGAAGIAGEAAVRLLESAAASSADALRAEFAGDTAVSGALDRLDRYVELLRAHGVAEWVRFDLSIVRGLAYYTGIVFELFDRRGEFRAICGGGRYDSLLEDLGGVDLPALGFGMGDVVLTELLRARGRMSAGRAAPWCWVAAPDATPATAIGIVDVASRLRRMGIATEYALREQSLSKQLKTAANLGVCFAVLLAPDVRAESFPQSPLVIRDLRNGTEQHVTVEQLFHAPAKYLATDRP
jgi:histidyl-tRNA synthetase